MPLNNNNIKSLNLNFGPQHPAAHGVLRLMLQLNNELILNNDIHIGLLHRGTEKLIENKLFLHALPYFDRLDYVSMLIQEHAYCLAIEKLLKRNTYQSNFAKIRSLYDELTRILNHLLAISCHALDVGSMSPLFWAFEEREKILEFYERISGARMHAAFYRPNYMNIKIISRNLLHDIGNFTKNCSITINEINNILLFNKIWKIRLINIGAYSLETALQYNLSGIMMRCTGLKFDLRLNLNYTYAYYQYLTLNSFISINGDCYDRFLLRTNEMLESLFLINQIIWKFLKFSYINSNFYKFQLKSLLKQKKKFSKKHMENVISHFKFWQDGISIPKNFIYTAVESPKGEFGVFLITNNNNKPFRCKIKSPAYTHLHLLNYLSHNIMLADLVTLIGTIDIVFGEVDR
jgi:NADH dehydrogenase (ubiquinone) Fe-S protein 2